MNFITGCRHGIYNVLLNQIVVIFIVFKWIFLNLGVAAMPLGQLALKAQPGACVRAAATSKRKSRSMEPAVVKSIDRGVVGSMMWMKKI